MIRQAGGGEMICSVYVRAAVVLYFHQKKFTSNWHHLLFSLKELVCIESTGCHLKFQKLADCVILDLTECFEIASLFLHSGT